MIPAEDGTGRYELRIDGDKLGDWDDLADVFDLIDMAMQRAPEDVGVFFHVEDWGRAGEPLRVCRARMLPVIWSALCEDAEIFALWLKSIGWEPVKPLPASDQAAGAGGADESR